MSGTGLDYRRRRRTIDRDVPVIARQLGAATQHDRGMPHPSMLRCLATLGVLVVMLAGCNSTVTGSGAQGTPTKPIVTNASTVTPPSSTPTPTSSLPTSPPTPFSSPAPSTAAAGPALCASANSQNATAQCLRSALSDFWSGQLNAFVSERVYLDATAAQVPTNCRGGITGAPAFTCAINRALYINKSLLDLIDRYVPAADQIYAFAAVQAHEMGHVLQYTLHQPQIGLPNPTDGQRQFLEQQADCLSGVWAHSERRFVGARFLGIAVQLLTLVSSNPEIATHGTPLQRAAAIERGLASGRPQSCRLVTFS